MFDLRILEADGQSLQDAEATIRTSADVGWELICQEVVGYDRRVKVHAQAEELEAAKDSCMKLVPAGAAIAIAKIIAAPSDKRLVLKARGEQMAGEIARAEARPGSVIRRIGQPKQYRRRVLMDLIKGLHEFEIDIRQPAVVEIEALTPPLRIRAFPERGNAQPLA